MITLHSFDVFDTCLTRKMAVPSSMFYLVAQKVFAKLAIPCSRSNIEDFITARINADKAARQQSSREDISLDEIWQNLIKSMGWPNDESLALCELDAEEKALVPIASTLKQVQAARQRGGRIVFTSDMYLPKSFIERQLVKHGFARAGDGFYVSSEVGKTKATGNLFRHLLVQEKLSASNVWHTGDSRRGDYVTPRKLGMHAQLYSQCKLTLAELGVMQGSLNSHGAAQIAGGMRAFRLGCESAEMQNINELASQFVAPYVMGFATWVLQHAQEKGVQRLYFMARGCALVWKVARELAPQFGGIDCRYLYVSRQALNLPSAREISAEGMPWMQRNSEKPTLKDLLGKLELKFEDVQPVLSNLAGNQGELFRVDSAQAWQRFWDALNTEPVRGRIYSLIASRRESARKYFESAGLRDPVRWALVDMGWNLTGQQSLRKLLTSWGWPDDIGGFYFGLKNERLGRAAAGESEALFYQPAFDFPNESRRNLFSNRIGLLEDIIGVGCADHPSVHHYQDLGEGQTDPAFMGGVNEAAVSFAQQLTESVLSFVAHNQALAANFKDVAFCHEVMSSLAANFFNFPTGRSAEALLGLSVGEVLHGLDSRPIVKPLTFGTALLPLLPKRGPLKRLWKSRNARWQEAVVAATPEATKRIAKAVERLVRLRVAARRALIG